MTYQISPNSGGNMEAMKAYLQMLLEPCDDFVEMDDTTARDINVIWASIENLATRWRGSQEINMPPYPRDRKQFWRAFTPDDTSKNSSLPVDKASIFL